MSGRHLCARRCKPGVHDGVGGAPTAGDHALLDTESRESHTETVDLSFDLNQLQAQLLRQCPGGGFDAGLASLLRTLRTAVRCLNRRRQLADAIDQQCDEHPRLRPGRPRSVPEAPYWTLQAETGVDSVTGTPPARRTTRSPHRKDDHSQSARPVGPQTPTMHCLAGPGSSAITGGPPLRSVRSSTWSRCPRITAVPPPPPSPPPAENVASASTGRSGRSRTRAGKSTR